MSIPNLVPVNVAPDARVYDDRTVPIQGILLHATGSKNEDGDITWLSKWHPEPVSIHRVIKRDGTIVQIVSDDKRAWHAGASMWAGLKDCNNWTIGIEIANDNKGEYYTPAQIESVAQTVAYLCALHHITDSMVLTHAQVRTEWLAHYPKSAAVKTDPYKWPMDAMWNRIQAIGGQWPALWPKYWRCSA